MINEILLNRRSTVNFSNKELNNEQIVTLFEAARWASSSYNEQPWRFIYAKSGSDDHQKVVDLLMPGNAVWARKAPLLIVSVAKTHLSKTNAENAYAFHDVGLSVGNLIFQATDMGLLAHQMGGFDKSKAKETLRIPEGYEPVTVLAIGYPGNKEDLNPDLKVREERPRTRIELNKLIFEGNWNDKN